MEDAKSKVMELTADIVAAFASQNAIPAADFPGLIGAVHAALIAVSTGAPVIEASSAPITPAVSKRKSITPDFLISLEDGKPYKSLKRHLRAKYGLSPEEYRAKWGLPKDYPMVAPNYSASRSAMAKKFGLGATGRGAKAAPPKAKPKTRSKLR